MMTLSTIAAQLGIDAPMPACVIHGVCTDTRDFQPGALFVAIVGPRFDGHDFVEEAVALGAAAVLVSRPMPAVPVPVLQVVDTQVALAKWAKATRLASAAQVVALTGSCGKTSTKTMLAAILSPLAPTVATFGNYNNEWGVPLTVLRLSPQDQFLVCEMGARRPGDIAYLTHCVQPDVALITNAGPAHLAGMGDVAGVARTKGEIFQGLRPAGTAVINADDPYADDWIALLSAEQSVLLFGQSKRADVRAESVTWNASHAASFVLCLPGNLSYPVTLQWVGAHAISNALAAAAAAYALGVQGTEIAAGLSASVPTAQRLMPVQAPSGALVIDDTYNANPASTRAAIAALAQQTGKTVLVLGDMLDLGDQAVSCHAEIGRHAKACGITQLYTYGATAAQAAAAFGERARHFDQQTELLGVLSPALAPGVTVLVKGSRAMGMEKLVAALLEEKV